MKFLCDACDRLLAVREFAVRDGALVLICPVCKAESVAPALARESTAAAASGSVSEAPRPAPVIALVGKRDPAIANLPRCPKCAALRDTDRADCPKCGLVFALYKPEVFALPAALEEKWAAAEARWEDTARHDDFVRAALAANLLPEAVRRYRIRAEQDPADALATRYRDDLIGRLMSLGSAAPLDVQEEKAQAKTVRNLLFTAVWLIAGVALYYFVRHLMAGTGF